MKIKKGDNVVVTTGKDKGATGEVIKALPALQKVVVKGVNVVKRHRKPTQSTPGGIVDMEKPIHVSNVALFDSSTKKPTKVGYRFEDGNKVRFSKKTQQAI